MNERDLPDGGGICHLHVTFEKTPQFETWFKFWYKDEETKYAMLEALEEEYRSFDLSPVLHELSREDAERILRDIYFMSYPSWEEAVQDDMIEPLITNPN